MILNLIYLIEVFRRAWWGPGSGDQQFQLGLRLSQWCLLPNPRRATRTDECRTLGRRAKDFS